MSYEVYMHGQVLGSHIFKLKGEFVQPDAYSEIAEKYFLPGGETGTAATVLSSFGVSVKIDGTHIGTEVAPLLKDFYKDKSVDLSSLYFDPEYAGLMDYVIVAGTVRSPMGFFQSLYEPGAKHPWNRPKEEDIAACKVAAIDSCFIEATEEAAELCVKYGKPYVAIDCHHESYLHQHSAINVVSRESIKGWIYPDKSMEEIYGLLTSTTDGLVIITCGGDEMLYGRKGQSMKRMKPFSVEVKSSLGAGDTFKAGCVYGLLKGMEDEKLVRFASACSGVAISRFPLPLNPPTLEAVENLIKSQEKQYKVGTKVIDMVDETREEKLGPAAGKRVVTARLYYPALVKNENQVVIPKKTVGEMYQEAEAVQEKFPLIVYNHGYGSYVEANNNLCCQLASQGYVVAAVGHAYEAEKLKLADGTEIPADKSIRKKQIQPQLKGSLAAIRMQTRKGSPEELYAGFDAFQKTYCKFLNERLPEWAKDVQCIVEMLRKDYAEQVDFSKGIGMTGHSFGGNLAYYMCMNFDEYVCGVNIDGGIFGNYEGMRMKRPFLQICNPGNEAVVSRALLHTDAPVEYEVFQGVTHLGFTDMAYYIKSKLMMGSMPYEERNLRLVQLHKNFFEKYLKQA